MKLKYILILLLASITLITSCRNGAPRQRISHQDFVNVDEIEAFEGLYLLNEGNMGSNRASLGYVDFKSRKYISNVYVSANPTVIKELGDVGNDIAIYKGRMYMIINVSNKLEVCDAYTAKRIGMVEIPNCRYIAFDGDYAYVTSYAGPVSLNPDDSQIGFVAKVDLNTLEVVDRCLVGYQPDGIAITNGHIYVANSGGYLGLSNVTKYERTVSVIDIKTFKEIKRIDVAYNLNHIQVDKRGNLWVSSRGDYKTTESRIFFIDTQKEIVTDTIKKKVADYVIVGDTLYATIGRGYGINTAQYPESYMVNTLTHKILKKPLIKPDIMHNIQTPYGIAVNPINKDIYITDVGSYASSGILYCFDKNGNKKWTRKAGQIPAHMAFLPKRE